MDPVTAIATATSAFNIVKKMVGAGREIEDTLGQIGKWYGAISDLNEAERRVKNPPLFKKIVASSSVEEEALQVYAAKKRATQQEKELRELLMYSYGPDGYKELVALRRSIREKREKLIYRQARRRKAFFWNTLQGILIIILGYGGYLLYSTIVVKIVQTIQ